MLGWCKGLKAKVRIRVLKTAMLSFIIRTPRGDRKESLGSARHIPPPGFIVLLQHTIILSLVSKYKSKRSPPLTSCSTCVIMCVCVYTFRGPMREKKVYVLFYSLRSFPNYAGFQSPLPLPLFSRQFTSPIRNPYLKGLRNQKVKVSEERLIKSPILERDGNILMHAVREKVCIYIGLQNYRNGPNGGKGRLQRKTKSR